MYDLLKMKTLFERHINASTEKNRFFERKKVRGKTAVKTHDCEFLTYEIEFVLF